MKDRQQRRAYRWESRFVHWNGQGFDTISGPRTWVRWACAQYKVPPPVVRGHYRRTGGTSFYDPNTHEIEFRKRHWNMAVALHEAAHAIVDYLLGPWTEAHGPQWLGVYMELLTRAGIAPRAALEASARAESLRWDRASGPRAFKAKHRARIKQATRERNEWT